MNKKSNFLATGTCCAFLLAAVGCGKQETPAAPATPASPSASAAAKDAQSAMGASAAQASQAATDVKQAAEKAAADTKQATEKVAADAQKATAAGADEAAKLAQSTLENVKKLIGEKKYQDALTALQRAATLQLTPEQKKTLDDLTAQVQTLLATDPTKAVGGLVPQPPQPK